MNTLKKPVKKINLENPMATFKITHQSKKLLRKSEQLLLTNEGIGLQSLNDPIDTTTSQGRLIFNIFASLAEFERDIIRERTQAGLKAARARGRFGGRPKGLSEAAEKKAVAAEALYKAGELSVLEICQNLSMSKATLYKYLRHRGVDIKGFKKKQQ